MKSSELSTSLHDDPQPLTKPSSWRSPFWLVLIVFLLGGGGMVWWRVLASVDQTTATAPQPPMPVQTIALQAENIEERSELSD